jgi:hypothetical protein
MCVPIRVVEVDDYNSVRGVGGIEDLHPSQPVAFLGNATTPHSMLATFASGTAEPSLAAFGAGPLRALDGSRGAQLQAAWIDGEGAHAIVSPAAITRGAGLGHLLGARGGDGGAITAETIVGATTACREQAPVVVLRVGAGERVVAANALGSQQVFAWALAQAQRRRATTEAPPARAVVSIRAGLVSASVEGLTLAQCHGDALGPFVALSPPSGVDGG